MKPHVILLEGGALSPPDQQPAPTARRPPKGLVISSVAVFALFAVATVTSLGAEPPAATTLTLAAAVDLALRDNPDLKSLRAKWEAMKERPAQAGALPNPMFKYGGMDTVSGGNWPDTNEKRFMIEQEFPWLGKRGLRAGIAAKDAEVAQRELEALTRDVVTMVKESYIDLYAVQQVTAITKDEEQVLHRMAKVAETLYVTGDRSQVDVIKAQTEITMQKQKLLELAGQESALKSKLNALLNRRADAPLGPAVAPPEPEFGGAGTALFAQAATNRPEVQAAQAQIDRYELERKLMAKESVSDYRLGVEYRDFADSADMVMVTVSVDLPVWQSKYRAGVREAVKMQESSRAARESAERQSAFDVQDASSRLLTACRTLELYRTELIPQAEARFGASEAAYRTGKVDFTDLLESERFLLSAKIMAVMTEGTVGMQSARLDRATGHEIKTGTPDATKDGEGGTEHGY